MSQVASSTSKENIVEPIKPIETEEVLEVAPDVLGSLIQRGRAYLLMGKLDESLKDINKALEIDPKNTLAISLLHEANAKKNKPKQRETHKTPKKPQKTPDLEPKASAISTDIINQDAKQNNANTSIERLNPQTEPQNPDFEKLITLGKSSRGKRQADDALIFFKRALEIYPNNAVALAERGEVYRMLNRFDEALRDLNAALKIDPQAFDPLISRCRVYLQQEKLNLAKDELWWASKLKPDDAWIMRCRGKFSVEKKS
jgi:tetratricopeptide (TPR) repeat protein